MEGTKFRVGALVLALAALFAKGIGTKNPALVETRFSRTVYPAIVSRLSRFTALVPFCVAETFGVLLLLVLVTWFFRRWRRTKRSKALCTALFDMLSVLGYAYFVFTLLWGLNYHRKPYAESAGLETAPASVSTLKALCEVLITDANALRELVWEDDEGVMRLVVDRKTALLEADLGFLELGQSHPGLSGDYGHPKPLLSSRAFSYMGLAGIYLAYTAEPCVNIEIPAFSLPSTMCHEMAHQRGFAREDEANFIAYLACGAHPNADFRYSGTMLATIHSMNALWRASPESYRELYDHYSDAVKRDLDAHRRFWQRFEGPVERITDQLNDTYLKAQGQADGVQSYGRMVDLLLAYHKNELLPKD